MVRARPARGARPRARSGRARLAEGRDAVRGVQPGALRRGRRRTGVGRGHGGDRRSGSVAPSRRACAPGRARAEPVRAVARRRLRARRAWRREPEQHALRHGARHRARPRSARGGGDARRRRVGRARERAGALRRPRLDPRVHEPRPGRIPVDDAERGVLPRMRMNGADAILRSLEAEGVDVAFGLPGGAILPLYDAFARGTTVPHVLARHEQGAGPMAQGYARASGRVGVAIATSGPGATNLVTPIADAWMDSTPLVCITGQVRTNLIGSDAFQECDITGITIPIVKHSWLVQDVEELPHVLKAAFHVARTGRCGPVLVDVPRDIQEAEFDFSYPDTVSLPGWKPPRRGHERQILAAAHAIAAAERPILYV